MGKITDGHLTTLVLLCFAVVEVTSRVDYCSLAQCANGGTCRNWNTTYDCLCLQGYAGAHCHVDIDECALNPYICQNGGTCINLHGTFRCLCHPSWSGSPLCDRCHHSMCGGFSEACVGNGLGDLECNCPPGTTGPDCTQDACYNHQCPDMPGMICSHQTGTNTTCQCDTGWFYQPPDCVDENECDIFSPCENGGICENSPGSYNCKCPSGYGGKDCQKQLDGCVLKLCGSDLECQARNENYTCLTGCKDEFDKCTDIVFDFFRDKRVSEITRACRSLHLVFKCLYSLVAVCSVQGSHRDVTALVAVTFYDFYNKTRIKCFNRFEDEYKDIISQGIEVTDEVFHLHDPRESVLTPCRDRQWTQGLPVRYRLTLKTTQEEATLQPWVRLVRTVSNDTLSPVQIWSVLLENACNMTGDDTTITPTDTPCVHMEIDGLYRIYFDIESSADNFTGFLYGEWWRPNRTTLWTQPVAIPIIYYHPKPVLYVNSLQFRLPNTASHIVPLDEGLIDSESWNNLTFCVFNLTQPASVWISNSETNDSFRGQGQCVYMSLTLGLTSPPAPYVDLRLSYAEMSGCGRHWSVTSRWTRSGDTEGPGHAILMISMITMLCIIFVSTVVVVAFTIRYWRIVRSELREY